MLFVPPDPRLDHPDDIGQKQKMPPEGGFARRASGVKLSLRRNVNQPTVLRALTPGVADGTMGIVHRQRGFGCLIDGFNLYHSIRETRGKTGADCRWLDIRSLCESMLYLIDPSARTRCSRRMCAYVQWVDTEQDGT